MKLCDDGHEEICYDVSMCPLCGRDSRIKELEDRVEELQKYVTELENQ